MNTPRDPSRRRRARGRTAPRDESARLNTPSKALAKTTQATSRHRLAWLVVAVLLGVSLVAGTSVWLIAEDARQARYRRQIAESRLLLTTQQLDSVFQMLWQRIATNPHLESADRAVLETWVRHDEKFVAHDPTDRESRFAQATAHRRIGQIAFVLDDPADAEGHFREAVSLFQELTANNPSVTGYLSEQADTFVRLAWVLDALGRLDEAVEAGNAAAEIMQQAPLPNDPVFNAQSAYSLLSLGDLCQRWQRNAEAQAHLTRAAELFRLLSRQYPNSGDYEGQLQRIESRLGPAWPAAEHGALPPSEKSPNE